MTGNPTAAGARRPGGHTPRPQPPTATATSSASVPSQAPEPVVPPSATSAPTPTTADAAVVQLVDLLKLFVDKYGEKIDGIENKLDELLALLKGNGAATTVLPAVATTFTPNIRQLALLLATSDGIAGLRFGPRRSALLRALVDNYPTEELEKLEEHADAVFAFDADHEPDLDQVRRNIADLCCARLFQAKAEGKGAPDVEDELSARIDSLPHAKKVEADHNKIFTNAITAVWGG